MTRITLTRLSEDDRDLLFVNPTVHSKGVGTAAWKEVERLYPKTRVWETCTPYFETRNIHYYVNKCGFLPVSGADGAYHSISGEKSVIAVDEDADFTIIYTDSDHDVMDVSFNAKLVNSKGDTMTGAVYPTTGEVDSGVPTTLTVTAPSDAGRYTIVVTYTGTYEEGGAEVDIGEIVDRFDIKAVEPITLSVDVSLKDPNVNLSGYGVYFWVDGERMEDSYTTFNVSSDGTGSVSYDWVADASKGKHVFWVESANGGVVDVKGLDQKHDFYIGDEDYSVYIALAVLFLIIVIIALVWVYRKPVKNFGKPKSRRK